MNKYTCNSCSREVVVQSNSDTISLKCCKGDSLTTFKKRGTQVIVPVKELPKTMTDKTPLPVSTPAAK